MSPWRKKIEDAHIKRSLHVCIDEGVASQIMVGIFDFYLVPLALFLKATTQQIGFLVSLPSLLASFSQFFCPARCIHGWW